VTERRGLPLPLLAAIAGTLLAWSSAFVVIRSVIGLFGPGELALLRMCVAAPLLALFMIGKKWVKPTAREWLLITAFGIGWFSTYIFALNTAEQSIDAGTASFLVNIGPLLIAIGASMFLGEKLPRNLLGGALVALSGVGLIAWATSSSEHFDIVGILWALVATVTYAIGVLTQKPALKRISSAQVTFLGAAISIVPLLVFAPSAIETVATAPTNAIFGIFWLGAIPTALGYGLWGYALTRMPASQLGVSTYLVPPMVVIESYLILGEAAHPLALAGGAIALAGVWWARRP
jgi:drug/metabolite transporter (DMT)-like permease